MADPDREIDAILHQIDHAIRQPQLAADFRILHQIFRHDVTDVKTAETDRSGNDQAAARPGALAFDGALGFLDIAENPPDAFQIPRTGIGELHRPRRSLQQSRAKTIFQRRNQPRHARGRKAEFAGRRGESPEIGDCHKGFHGIDAIHAIIS